MRRLNRRPCTPRRQGGGYLRSLGSEGVLIPAASIFWQGPQVWSDNQLHVRPLLGWTASVSSDSEVRETIASAIENDSELLPFILRGSVQWVEHRDRNTMEIMVIDNSVSELPPLFPTGQIVAEIRNKMPDLEAAEHKEGGQQHAEPTIGLARIATRTIVTCRLVRCRCV